MNNIYLNNLVYKTKQTKSRYYKMHEYKPKSGIRFSYIIAT